MIVSNGISAKREKCLMRTREMFVDGGLVIQIIDPRVDGTN